MGSAAGVAKVHAVALIGDSVGGGGGRHGKSARLSITNTAHHPALSQAQAQ